MKILELLKLSEMTYRTGISHDNAELKNVKNSEKSLYQGSVVGNIDNFKVKYSIGFPKAYSVWDDDKIVARVNLVPGRNEVQNSWVSQEYRNQRMTSKLFRFIIDYTNEPLLRGDAHSEDTYNTIKNNGYREFKKSWYNTKTREERPFDMDTVEEFYTKTGEADNYWQLLMR
jgi:hypothetical protein